MGQLKMKSIPAFSDIQNADISSDQALTDQSIQAISNNAKFGATRLEIIYMGFWADGNLILPPASPVDGYQYSYPEVSFLWMDLLTRSTGPIVNILSIIDASNTTPITITVNSDTAGLRDMEPVTVASVGGNTAANGSFSITNITSSGFDLVGSAGTGAYTSGGTATFSAFFTPGQALPPPQSNTQSGDLAYLFRDISSTGRVSINTRETTAGPGAGLAALGHDGIIKVFAVCQRSMSMLASPTFTDISPADIVGGAPLKDATIQQLSANAKFGAVRQEVIPMGDHVHGDVLAAPASPVDGYAYSLPECAFFWSVKATRSAPDPPAAIYFMLWDINDSTGVVSLRTDYWNNSHETVTNDGIIKVFCFAQRGSVNISN